MTTITIKPTLNSSKAFSTIAWGCLLTSTGTFAIGLAYSSLPIGSIGFFAACLLFGLFGTIATQKTIRDQLEGIPTTNLFKTISILSTILAISGLTLGLFLTHNMSLSERGFFAMASILALFSTLVIQKNERDTVAITALSSQSHMG